MKNKVRKSALVTTTSGTMLLLGATVSGTAQADGLFSNMGFDWGGFVRAESAFRTGTSNPFNQDGDPYNGVPVRRQTANPLGWGPILPDGPLTNIVRDLGLGALLDNIPVVNGELPIGDTAVRAVPKTSNDFNVMYLRAELEGTMRITNSLSLIGRLRAIYDPTVYDSFDGTLSYGDGGATLGGDASLYRGRTPNYFEYRVGKTYMDRDADGNPVYRVEGGGRANPLEWAGKDYQVYFPALILQYNEGPLNVRLGNQQIAWGQALFFRVFDVVDGLDLRRHSVLDTAQEEFSDKRVPALALRVGYQFSESWLADAYVQKFQPTIYGNPNTQYNVIPAQFTIHDMYKADGYDSKLSYGLRIKGDYGQWGVQAAAVRRYNPDGVFAWTKSGVNHNLPNTNLFGIALNTLYGGDTGSILAETPFEATSTGVWTADEWFNYAAMVRLDGTEGLNSAINGFQPATGQLLASAVDNFDAAYKQLNTFFYAAGGAMRGHLSRKYFVENVFALGASYVVEGEPGSILDQLIINLETSYTPNRVFTNPNLSNSYLTENAFIGALVLEKYQRFSAAFPATYMVFQYMFRDKDDIFGRSLKGYGGTVSNAPTGIGSANYVAFAFQQPFPQSIWRLDFAALYDIKGGILVQPGVRWKPAGEWTVDMFYSYIDTLSGNPNDNALSTAGFADEFTLRVTYQF